MAVDLLTIRASTYAAISTFFSVIFTVIAFSTPYWLRNERRQHFENLGLWEACFIHLRDPHFTYDNEFHGCRWLFDEDYAFLRTKLLEPPFFLATQIFYTLGFVLLILAVIGTLAIELCFITDRESLAMKLLSLTMGLSAFCCTLAVIIFGIRGDDRDWMPDPEHNYLSWSFGLAVVGCFCHWIAAVLFMVEARLLDKRKDKHNHHTNGYHMDQMKA